ncbi:hypothetical protein SF83666_b52530 (plasmid) [Sinorhizobium fredii CCBAU 83666]|nr:hypothetical protein SF83666_b52530 [Sinorhizobium fredii CCBAU 83666]
MAMFVWIVARTISGQGVAFNSSEGTTENGSIPAAHPKL